MKIQILFAAFVVSNLFATIALHADECWTVSNIRGFSAYSDQNYEFTKDGISNVTIICLSEKGYFCPTPEMVKVVTQQFGRVFFTPATRIILTMAPGRQGEFNRDRDGIGS